MPLQIMEKCAEGIALAGHYAAKGSVLAVSDAGCAAVLCKAALQAASLNVFINTLSLIHISIDLDRKKNCYIANIVKCRPPQNRDPLPAESEACRCV